MFIYYDSSKYWYKIPWKLYYEVDFDLCSYKGAQKITNKEKLVWFNRIKHIYNEHIMSEKKPGVTTKGKHVFFFIHEIYYDELNINIKVYEEWNFQQ